MPLKSQLRLVCATPKSTATGVFFAERTASLPQRHRGVLDGRSQWPRALGRLGRLGSGADDAHILLKKREQCVDYALFFACLAPLNSDNGGKMRRNFRNGFRRHRLDTIEAIELDREWNLKRNYFTRKSMDEIRASTDMRL